MEITLFDLRNPPTQMAIQAKLQEIRDADSGTPKNAHRRGVPKSLGDVCGEKVQ